MQVEVPEAWSFARIREIVEGVAAGRDLEANTELTKRQVSYHLQAGRTLGWVERHGRGHRVTKHGEALLATQPGSAEEHAAIRGAVAASALVQEVLPGFLAGMTAAEIAEALETHPTVRLAPATALKRAKALRKWLDQLETVSAAGTLAADAGQPPATTQLDRSGYQASSDSSGHERRARGRLGAIFSYVTTLRAKLPDRGMAMQSAERVRAVLQERLGQLLPFLPIWLRELAQGHLHGRDRRS